MRRLQIDSFLLCHSVNVVWQPMTSDVIYHCYPNGDSCSGWWVPKVHSMHWKHPMCLSPPLPPIKQGRWWLYGRGGLCVQPLVFAFVYAQLPRLYPGTASWPTFLPMSLFVSLFFILPYILDPFKKSIIYGTLFLFVISISVLLWDVLFCFF